MNFFPKIEVLILEEVEVVQLALLLFLHYLSFAEKKELLAQMEAYSTEREDTKDSSWEDIHKVFNDLFLFPSPPMVEHHGMDNPWAGSCKEEGSNNSVHCNLQDDL